MQPASPVFSQPPALLILAPPTESTAESFAQALRQLGWRAVVATTADDAQAQATGMLAAVCILRPATQDDPLFAATQALPLRLIPVFAEPMILPAGRWYAAPILLAEDVVESAKQVIWAVVPPPTAAPNSTPYLPYDVTPSATKRHFPKWLAPVIIAVCAALVVGCFGLYIGVKSFVTPVSGYTTTAPGSGCDKGGALWRDSSDVTLACHADGTTVTQKTNLTKSGTLNFYPPHLNFTKNYSISVQVAIQSATHYDAVGIGVRGATGKSGYLFYVRNNGEWYIDREDNSVLHRLAFGFLSKPSSAFTFAISSQGPVLTLNVNGKTIKTIYDDTYSTTTNARLLMGSGDQATPESVVFSHFAYTALPDTFDSAPAHATATAQQSALQKPYTTATQGLGCDTGGGIWESPEEAYDQNASATCAGNGLQITSATKSTTTSEFFYWLNGQFPDNYSISVDIDQTANPGGCAGLATRASSDGLYRFMFCTDGKWFLHRFQGTQDTLLRSGTVSLKTVNTLAMKLDGAHISVTINGAQVTQVDDSTYTKTSFVRLTMNPNPKAVSGTVRFANFVFTPLP